MNPIVREDCLRILNQVPLQDLKERSVLLTGANGLFGSYLVQLFSLCKSELNIPLSLHCISRHGPRQELAPLVDGTSIMWHSRDLTEPIVFKEPVHYILHAASYGQPRLWMEDKLKTIDLNVTATRSLLELAREQGAHFLFFSSQDVYGDIPLNQPARETFNGNLSPLGARAAYGESKRLGETICSIFAAEGLAVHIARIGHTYGPGVSIHDGRVLGDFIRMALIDKCIQARDPGLSIKTFGYAADIIEMLLLIALRGKELVYNVGGRDRISIKQLGEAVGRLAGGVPATFPARTGTEQHIGTDSAYSGVDIGLFEKEFGPRNFTPLEEGLRRTIEWNRQMFLSA